MRQHISADDMVRGAVIVQKKANGATTFHSISRSIALACMFGFATLWIRFAWIFIDPHVLTVVNGHYDPAYALAGLADVLLAFVIGIACSSIPSIALSGMISNTPANALLFKMYYKYGKPGVGVMLLLLCVTGYASAVMLDSYLRTKPMTADDWQLRLVFVLVLLLIMIGFPSWALNTMTPEQWAAAMRQSMEAARLEHAIHLMELNHQAKIAHAQMLLSADLKLMTVEQRLRHNRELMAMLASSEIEARRAVRSVANSIALLGRMEEVTSVDDEAEKEQIITMYQNAADQLNDVYERTGRRVEWLDHRIVQSPSAHIAEASEEVVVDQEPAIRDVLGRMVNDAPSQNPPAVTVDYDMVNDAPSQNPPAVTVDYDEPTEFAGEYHTLLRMIGDKVFMASTLSELMRWDDTSTARKRIKTWEADGFVEPVQNGQKGRYVFTVYSRQATEVE